MEQTRSAWSLLKLALKLAVLALPVVALAFLNQPKARAVPSYARQTGLPCSSCHYTPPELTPFGRQFKMEGYTFSTAKQVKEPKTGHSSGLNLLEEFPLSVVFDTSYTATNSPQPATQNGNFEFPQDVSLFLAGAWSDHVGSFVQVTYHGQGDHFSWDNTDIRYARNDGHILGKPLTYGITLNNNPTVEDPWNSTPAWGYPFVANDLAPSPAATEVINGRLAQDVAGIGGYGLWDNHLYIAGTIYRSEHIGGPQPNPGIGYDFNIRGVAPYWRVAWQASTKNNQLEVGTYGMHVRTSPGAVTGITDSYTDWAVDFQYDRTIPQFKNDVLSVRGTYIRENSSLAATYAAGGAAFPGHHLDTVQGNVEYHFGNRYSGTAGWFNISGTNDALLYAPAPVTGSIIGGPGSMGYLLNLSWWPVQNINIGAQYTGYIRFNGAGTNYDGAGRNAGANNATYLLARFVF